MIPQHHYLLKIMFFISFFCFSNMVWAEVVRESSIHVPVNKLHASLLNIMENDGTKSFQERYNVIEEIVVTHFNTPLIAKIILGRYWKTLEKQDQKDFIDSFNRLTISTYVNRFNFYNGEFFKTLSIEQMKKNRFLIRTEFVRVDDKPISFNYIVQSNMGVWKIISVIANGINDLSLKRADYSSVIKERGFDPLITSLKQKIKDLEPK